MLIREVERMREYAVIQPYDLTVHGAVGFKWPSNVWIRIPASVRLLVGYAFI